MKSKTMPKYRQVNETLLNYLSERKFQPGQRLPTEMELMEEFGVSRTTIRQALSMLQEVGIVETRQGSGTYYCGNRVVQRDAGYGSGSKLIGLVNFFSMDYIYADIVRGIRDTVEHAGYHLVLAHCDTDASKEVEFTERLLGQGVQGLVVEPSQGIDRMEDFPLLEFVRRSPVPVVATHWDVSYSGCSVVTVDDELAGYRATKHLIELGHSRIAIISTRSVRSGLLRSRGYEKALVEAGLPLNPRYMKSYTNDEEFGNAEPGYSLAKELFLQEKEHPTAIFFFNDHMAQQGYLALREMGISIPEDVSVIGFDNYRTSGLLKPGLTTFEHPKYQLGAWAARVLLDRIQNKQSMPIRMVFEPPLVSRGSTAQARP